MRFSQNNMLEKTKKYKKIIVVCIVAILFMVISFIFIYQTYIQKIIYEERLNQMDEVTHQMFLNLEDVMETKWDYVKVQCNIIEAADIRTTEDLSLHMKRITDLYEFTDLKITRKNCLLKPLSLMAFRWKKPIVRHSEKTFPLRA